MGRFELFVLTGYGKRDRREVQIEPK